MESLVVIAGVFVAVTLCLLADYLEGKRAAHWLTIRRRIGL